MALNLYAAEGIRQVPVHFKKGASQATIQGRIKGRETIDYVLNARAGQTMTVNLKTSHTGAYFNVLPPGSDEALFTGQVGGRALRASCPRTATTGSGFTWCAPRPGAASRRNTPD